MKERPILFSGPMVRAIREGPKTQTRRIVKPQPCEALTWRGWIRESTYPKDEGKALWTDCFPCASQAIRVRCPYGKPGDRLWVRETWCHVGSHSGPHTQGQTIEDVRYKADGYGCVWRPSIHMPRWASRITLDITAVRVERWQDITEGDALQEGAVEWWLQSERQPVHGLARNCFKLLWRSIHGYGSWDANPWV